MLTPSQAYQVGFFTRCLAAGVPVQQIPALAKAASLKLAELEKRGAGPLWDTTKGLFSMGAGWGIPLALAAPPIAGSLAGYGVGQLTDLDDTDVKDIKTQELTDEYERATNRLRQETALRQRHRTKQHAYG